MWRYWITLGILTIIVGMVVAFRYRQGDRNSLARISARQRLRGGIILLALWITQLRWHPLYPESTPFSNQVIATGTWLIALGMYVYLPGRSTLLLQILPSVALAFIVTSRFQYPAHFSAGMFAELWRLFAIGCFVGTFVSVPFLFFLRISANPEQ